MRSRLTVLGQERWSRTTRSGDSLRVLTSLGLVYLVSQLVENGDNSCEIIHGFGTNTDAEHMERELAEAAQAAGQKMLGEELANAHSDKYIIPVYDSYPDVQLVGVFRMRYRPKTSLTADWMRRLSDSHREWMPVYSKLAGRAVGTEAILIRIA